MDSLCVQVSQLSDALSFQLADSASTIESLKIQLVSVKEDLSARLSTSEAGRLAARSKLADRSRRLDLVQDSHDQAIQSKGHWEAKYAYTRKEAQKSIEIASARVFRIIIFLTKTVSGVDSNTAREERCARGD